MNTRDELGIKGSICWVLRGPDGKEKARGEAPNIITNEGDQFYAHRGAEEQPADTLFTNGVATAFDGIMELGTAGNAPGKASDRDDVTAKVTGTVTVDATYPRTNDPDGDNTGAGVDIVTYRYTFPAGTATSNGIDREIITNPTPGVGENVLQYATISPTVNKGAQDTLKVFVNHECLGS